MYTPPPGPPPPPMPYRPQRPPRQGVPAIGVILLCGFFALAGCVTGAALASPTPTKSASATATPSPSASSSTTATRKAGGEGDDDRRARPKRTTAKPTPTRKPTTKAPSLDRRYPSCAAANRAGHGPYVRGVDAEYRWYQDRDGDGRVCERR